MGFFSSSTESTSTYDNPELRQYTAAYRGAAPWGFATLDPTATLAAMGKGSKLGDVTIDADYKEYLKGLSADEKRNVTDTNAALDRIRQRQETGQFLTPQETDFINTNLDKAFAAAQKFALQDWEQTAQKLAGSRGLRTSDTPVAKPALEELRNLQLGLSSQRAGLGMDATLGLSKQQQEFDASFAQFNQQLAFNQWSTRQGFLFGGGMQAASNLGYTQTQKNTQNMSGFQKVMAGFQMASAAQAFGTNAMTMGMTGTPSSNVGGSSFGGSEGWGKSAQGMSGLMSGAAALSDRRLKTNVKRIGTHTLGIGIYTYTIAGQHAVGVMADEVRTVKPEAVVRYADGYDRVNYNLL